MIFIGPPASWITSTHSQYNVPIGAAPVAELPFTDTAHVSTPSCTFHNGLRVCVNNAACNHLTLIYTDFAVRTPAPSISFDQSSKLWICHGCKGGSILVARHV